ncbi:lipoprotein [Spiroplasma clarkii]|uniref:Lipoprotein n=1 Tax=Spiroplasma clarkii TaxID=2139 RepID=A0A2K8KGW0_9MOLU|nr:lipoprotein [Spiroplasma clarkii]ATX70915.1 hypothetical protein SCLAR_v1c05960 [Spiroplasma clarkii]
MKKLLSIIGATTLITSTVASVAACSKSEMSIKVDSGWISKDSVSDITALALDKIAFPNIKKAIVREYGDEWWTKIYISYLTFAWEFKENGEVYKTSDLQKNVGNGLFDILTLDYTITYFSFYSEEYESPIIVDGSHNGYETRNRNVLTMQAVHPDINGKQYNSSHSYDIPSSERARFQQIMSGWAHRKLVIDMKVKKI